MSTREHMAGAAKGGRGEGPGGGGGGEGKNEANTRRSRKRRGRFASRSFPSSRERHMQHAWHDANAHASRASSKRFRSCGRPRGSRSSASIPRTIEATFGSDFRRQCDGGYSRLSTRGRSARLDDLRTRLGYGSVHARNTVKFRLGASGCERDGASVSPNSRRA